jgi:hypothetical protein
MYFLSNVFDGCVRIEAKYNFLLQKLLPVELSFIKYSIAPKISRGVFFVAIFGFFLRLLFPFSLITIWFSGSFCYLLSVYFILTFVLEIFVFSCIYNNIWLFFPTQNNLTRSNSGILAEGGGMALKIVGSSGFKGLAAGLGFLYLVDGVYGKMNPESEGLLEGFGRNLSHPHRAWKGPK